MYAAITLFAIVSLSALITRIAAIALAHTGLSTESARFQARSAYTGAGFTTTESEKIMNYPVRRKIIYMLMLVGNAGIVTTMSTLILTFVLPDSAASRLCGLLIVVVVGLSFLWWAIRSAWVDRWLSKVIERALKKYTKIDVKDYASILRLSGEYEITEYKIREGSWLMNKSLLELELRKEGITVLGIQKDDGMYDGSPNGNSIVELKDVITLYGKSKTFENLRKRQEEKKAGKEDQ